MKKNDLTMLLLSFLLVAVVACKQETTKNDADTVMTDSDIIAVEDDMVAIDDGGVVEDEIVSDDTILISDTDADTHIGPGDKEPVEVD
ncbi:MAG TPA: hypothetical protein PKH10_14075, partial [bacterium]|nr:hypothetical protein [bacterium]